MIRCASPTRFFSLASLVTVLAYFSLYLLQMQRFADDPGVGWHLETGRWIRQNGEIPRVDPFLASERRSWVADQWLSDLVLSKLYDAGGWTLLYVSFAGVWILTFFAVLFPAIRAHVGSALAALVAALFAFKAAQVHFILRPIVLSIGCFAGVFVIARGFGRRSLYPSGTRVLRGVSLAALFALWSNLHPAFVLGLLVVLLLPLARFLDGERRVSELVGLCALAVSCVLATLVNPYGLALHESIVSLGQSAYFMRLNSEWLPPSRGSFEGELLIVLVGALTVATIVSPSFRRGVGWFDILATGLLTFGAFRSVRFIPFAVIAGAFPLAVALGCLEGIRTLPVFRLSGRLIGALERWTVGRPSAGVAAVLCAVVGILGGGLMPLPQRLGPRIAQYPPEVSEAIRADAREGVVLASPDFGGFITATLYPSFRAVIDDRNTLIGEDLYRQYFASLDSPHALSALLQRFEVTHLILPRDSTVGKELASERRWPILLDDGKSLVVRVVRQ